MVGTRRERFDGAELSEERSVFASTSEWYEVKRATWFGKVRTVGVEDCQVL